MTVVTTPYILVEKHGLDMRLDWGIALGLLIGAAALLAFLLLKSRWPREDDGPQVEGKPSAIEKSMDGIAS